MLIHNQAVIPAQDGIQFRYCAGMTAAWGGF